MKNKLMVIYSLILILAINSQAYANNTDLINSLVDTSNEHAKEANRRLERLEDAGRIHVVPNTIDYNGYINSVPATKPQVIVVPSCGVYNSPANTLNRLKYRY